ncbi:MAG TPA: hypothetical protein VL049_25765, partial [Candidatus Dormibacteraeota bacterium]|nr:hypothetical protein [Candidatus Dormibacteraeota bacterium]
MKTIGWRAAAVFLGCALLPGLAAGWGSAGGTGAYRIHQRPTLRSMILLLVLGLAQPVRGDCL